MDYAGGSVFCFGELLRNFGGFLLSVFFFGERGKVLIDSLLRFEEDYELVMMNGQELGRANDLEVGFDMDFA